MKRVNDRARVAVNFENDRLMIVGATVGASSVTVKAWVCKDRPAGVAQDDAGAIGKWLRDEIIAAGLKGMARGGIVFAVPRGEVVLKRLSFPRGTEAGDVPGMVRLQMVRQLTVAAEHAAIDFVSLSSDGSMSADGGETASGMVIAAAVPGDRMEWRRRVAKASGFRLARVTLKASGAAALLAPESVRIAGGTMGISIGSGSTEFVVVENGQLVFARATDLVRPPDSSGAELFAKKVAVEAKRTWMSHRVSSESAPIEKVTVVGADEVGLAVAAECAAALEQPCGVADFPDFVRVPAEMDPAARAQVASLVGTLAETLTGERGFDFLHPRRAPDLRAKVRRRVLVGALAAILAVGVTYTVGAMHLRELEGDLETAKSEYARVREQYMDLVREEARLAHVEHFLAGRPNWMDHVLLIADQMPSSSEAVLDSVGGRCTVEVMFSPPGTRGRFTYPEGKWGRVFTGTVSMAGSMKKRTVADELRDRLVSDDRYRIQTQGADVAERFEWTLRTNTPAPEIAAGTHGSSEVTP